MKSTAAREEALFTLALAKPPSERGAFLDRECADNPALRQRLDDLLAAHEQPDTLLAPPSADSLLTRPTIRIDLPDERVDDTVVMTLGRYKLLERLGEGGCGVVYVAEQTEPVRRRVALKVIKLGMDTKAVVARFEAERQALAMMDHPNIAKVLDAGATDSGRPYFVMELVRGIRITEYCDQAQLSTRERLDLFIMVCQAIQHAHQKGIIHRDIKPSNILVTLHDGVPVPKVIDFGIAKATEGRLTDATVYTQLNQFIGTPAYMSPEQAEMSGLDIDTRTDIYALGVLLYELLAGSTPFDAKELMASGLDAMRNTIREQEPQRPSTRLDQTLAETSASTAEPGSTQKPRTEEEIRASTRRLHQVKETIAMLRGDLDWIVMKALEKDRTRRYDTANGLAQDIQRHLDNEPVVACPPSNLYRLRKFVRRNKLGVIAVSAVAAALVVGLGLSTWAFLGEREARTRAVAAESEQSRERSRAEMASQAATEARDHAAKLLSLSQTERGTRLLANRDDTGLLYLLEARKTVELLPEERMARTLLWNGWYDSLPQVEEIVPPATNQVRSLTFSSSGKWLATGTGDGKVLFWDATNGRELAAVRLGNQPVEAVEFSADDRLLAVKTGPIFQLWNIAPLLSNQPPHPLVRRAQWILFDRERRRAVCWVNDGIRLPGEPEPPPSSVRPNAWELKVWDSESGQARDSKWTPEMLV